ncbi:MAG: hypothetical protein H6726_07890 [Sandaracinaceae bacterium]|nr:hypothetical protein [Myxococcales bacterium]MCB9657551.1 hypothetical protein [Sandaracinaceae bacterium]
MSFWNTELPPHGPCPTARARNHAALALLVLGTVAGCGDDGGSGTPDAGSVDAGEHDSSVPLDGALPGADADVDGGAEPPCAPNGAPFGGGAGSAADPFTICATSQWMALDEDPDAHYRLTADLDFSGVTYTPIADFRGTLDGGGHTLSHVTIAPAAAAGAPFDELNGATLTDLRITQLEVTHAGPAAGLALELSLRTIPSGTRPSTVRDVHVSGTVTSTGSDTPASGLVGTFVRGTVEDVSFEGAVSGFNASGFADWVQQAGTVRRVRVDATLDAAKDAAGAVRLTLGTLREVAVHGSATGGLHVSGLLGALAGGLLADAYADMALTLDFTFPIDPGGLLADQSYRAAGAVTEPRYGTQVRFERVYFGGTITADEPPAAEETVTDGLFACWGGYTGCGGTWVGSGCYWDTDTSGESAPGGGRTECVGLTSAQLTVGTNTPELVAPTWTPANGAPPRLAFEDL